MNKPLLRCVLCGREYAINEKICKCHCGGILNVVNTVLFTKESLNSRPHNFWRYKEAFGWNDEIVPIQLGEVMTPIVSTNFRGYNIDCKLEYILPTGSYKDRGISVCINNAKKAGIKAVSEDSSGNAGASTAAYSAAAGIEANIYVPTYTSTTKVNQIRIFAANAHCIEGDRSASSAEAQKERKGVYYIGHSWNPLFAAGVKTAAYEIAEQYGWIIPDWIVAPCGGGGLVLGLVDGFSEMVSAGYVDKMPRIIAAQAENCSPFYEAWKNNSTTTKPFTLKPTYAEGVALANPVRGNQVLHAMREINGLIVAANEGEIISAWKDSAKKGIFIEPTAAVALAAVYKAIAEDKVIKPTEKIVVLLTGNGLKTKSELML